MQPSSDMLEPIEALARFMATGEAADLAGAFAPDCLILENFPPFLFEGAQAFEGWREGFRRHVEDDGLQGLTHRFGDAQDFARDGERVYFVLPTRWSGEAHGRPFSEEGGWAFVLARIGGRWRIRSYAWAVTFKA